MKRLALVLALGGLTACATAVDRFTVDRVVGYGIAIPDVDEVCELGVSLRHGLGAAGTREEPPHLAMVISEAAAGLCDEALARETALERLRVEHSQPLGPVRAAEVKDARLLEARYHQRAAARFSRSWGHLEAQYGPVGVEDTCPRIARRDEVAWLLGLIGGALGLVHDRGGGGTSEITFDRMAQVGRAAGCLDNERWFYIPQALTSVAWALVPGLAPEGEDGWTSLRAAAVASSDTGVRVAWCLYTLAAATAGHDDKVEDAIRGQAEAMAATPTNPDWGFLDEYARLLTLYESDRIWTEAEGHRTPVFGQLPGDEAASGPEGDPFGGDPFGGDPFGGDPFGGEPTAPTVQETPAGASTPNSSGASE